MPPPDTDHLVPLQAIIVGTGFGGIGMAIAFQKAGVNDVLLLEKGADVGGVWRDNSYPGAACDVPSHLYSFSFEPNAEWSNTHATQPEIHAYLKKCVDKYSLRPRIRFEAEVAKADYDEQASTWDVTLTNGELLRARMFITATGQLSRPSIPKLPGMESFKGRAFHSAQWDHDYSLAGKRVAVVGTGASAIQFVPAIADLVKKLTLLQRSAPWLIPRADRPYAAWRKKLFRQMPSTMALHRALIYARYEVRVLAVIRFKSLMKIAVGIPFRRMLEAQVPDASLREKLTPDYPYGCKRILTSSEYLSTLAKPHVNVVTLGIRKITEDGIETADGTHHTVDAIIYGTGFTATEHLSPMRITGRAGKDLNHTWRMGASAYIGLTVPGFPNFFMLYGPNTNLGHNSVILMLESQAAHVIRCMRAMKIRNASAIEVDAQHHVRFNAWHQKRLARTVWNGCKSWYVNESGHNSTNWAGSTLGYRWLTNIASLRAYSFTRH